MNGKKKDYVFFIFIKAWNYQGSNKTYEDPNDFEHGRIYFEIRPMEIRTF